MRVRDNVELPLRQKKHLSKARRRELVGHALHAVGLDDAAGAYPWQLSGGMQQRVAIARAVAYEPEVLLMDEPFAAVDAQTRADLEDLVRRLWQELGVTVLFITHDIDEAVYLGERVVILSSSTVVQEQLTVDLPAGRDQLHTRADPRFTELRTRVYEEVQAAKRGGGADAGAPSLRHGRWTNSPEPGSSDLGGIRPARPERAAGDSSTCLANTSGAAGVSVRRATRAVTATSHSSDCTSSQVWVVPLRGFCPVAPTTAWATSPTSSDSFKIRSRSPSGPPTGRLASSQAHRSSMDSQRPGGGVTGDVG